MACCFAAPASYPLGPVSEPGKTWHLQAFNVFRRPGFCFNYLSSRLPFVVFCFILVQMVITSPSELKFLSRHIGKDPWIQISTEPLPSKISKMCDAPKWKHFVHQHGTTHNAFLLPGTVNILCFRVNSGWKKQLLTSNIYIPSQEWWVVVFANHFAF